MAYRRVSLGRMAVFLLPSLQLKSRDKDGTLLEERIHRFLLANFSAYTAQAGNIFGYWKDARGHDVYGEHKVYKVSYEGKDRIAVLEAFLAEMGKLLERGCRQFKFVDRTFNLNLAVTRRILEFFLERLRPGLFLHFEMVPDRLPPELRELIARFPPGQMQLEVGVQTFNPEVAALISRRSCG